MSLPLATKGVGVNQTMSLATKGVIYVYGVVEYVPDAYRGSSLDRFVMLATVSDVAVMGTIIEDIEAENIK